MTSIGTISRAELVAASKANMVTGLAVGIDTGGQGAIVKLRTPGADFLYFFDAKTCAQWLAALRKASRKHRWQAVHALNDVPRIGATDWHSVGTKMVGPSRLEAFSDVAVLAFCLLGSDLVRAFQMQGHLAAVLCDGLAEQFGKSGRSQGEPLH